MRVISLISCMHDKTANVHFITSADRPSGATMIAGASLRDCDQFVTRPFHSSYGADAIDLSAGNLNSFQENIKTYRSSPTQ